MRLNATAPMLPAIRVIISARRKAVVELWDSSAAPATGWNRAWSREEGKRDVIGDVGHGLHPV